MVGPQNPLPDALSSLVERSSFIGPPLCVMTKFLVESLNEEGMRGGVRGEEAFDDPVLGCHQNSSFRVEDSSMTPYVISKLDQNSTYFTRG